MSLATLLSQLLVEVPKAAVKSGGGSVGGALGSALGAGLGQGLSQGFGGSVGGQTAPTGQAYTGSTPNIPTTVDALTNTVQGGGGSDYLLGGDNGSYSGYAGLPSAVAQGLANTGGGAPPTDVAGVDVTIPKPQLADIAPAADTSGLYSSMMQGFSPASLPAGFGQGMSMANMLSPLQVLAPAATQPPGNFTGLVSALPAGITPQSTLDQVPTYQGAAPTDGGIPKEAGLLGLLGLNGAGAGGGLKGLSGIAGLLSTLLPLYLAGKLVNGQNEAQTQLGQNQTNQNKTIDTLGQLGGNTTGLVNSLTNKVNANLLGNIGGPAMNAIQRNVNAAQAAIRQRYHNMGMSGSTAEVQDLNGAAQAGLETQFKIANDMASTGLNAIGTLTGQSILAYGQILNAQMAQGTALGNAAAAFAGASSTALGTAGAAITGALKGVSGTGAPPTGTTTGSSAAVGSSPSAGVQLTPSFPATPPAAPVDLNPVPTLQAA